MLKFRKIIALALAAIMLVCVSGCDAVTQLFNNTGSSPIEYKAQKSPVNSPVEMPYYFVNWIDYFEASYDEEGVYVSTERTEERKFGTLKIDVPEKLDFLKNQSVGNKILKQINELLYQKVELAESIYTGEPRGDTYNSANMYISRIINNIAVVSVNVNIDGYIYFARVYLFDLETGLAIGPEMIFADDFDWQYELSKKIALRTLAESDGYDMNGYTSNPYPFKGLDDSYYFSVDARGINVNPDFTYDYLFSNVGFFDYAQFDGQIALFERYPAVVKDIYSKGEPQYEFFIQSERVTIEDEYADNPNGLTVSSTLSMPKHVSEEIRQSILDIYNTRPIYDSIKNNTFNEYAYYSVRIYAEAFAGYIVVNYYEDFYSQYEAPQFNKESYIIDAETNLFVTCADFFKIDVDLDSIIVERFIEGLEYQRRNEPAVYEQLLELAQSGRLLESGYDLTLSSHGFSLEFYSEEIKGIYFDADTVPFDRIGIDNLTLFD